MADSGIVDDGELVDEDGYPTEAGLGRLRAFHGSPRQLVELLETLWWLPTLVTVDGWLDADLRESVRVSLVTGGWSGNEELIITLAAPTMFHLRFWESSHRGGRHVYEVPKAEWEAVGNLGFVG